MHAWVPTMYIEMCYQEFYKWCILCIFEELSQQFQHCAWLCASKLRLHGLLHDHWWNAHQIYYLTWRTVTNIWRALPVYNKCMYMPYLYHCNYGDLLYIEKFRCYISVLYIIINNHGLNVHWYPMCYRFSYSSYFNILSRV